MTKELHVEFMDGESTTWEGMEGVKFTKMPDTLHLRYPDDDEVGIPLRNVRQWWTEDAEEEADENADSGGVSAVDNEGRRRPVASSPDIRDIGSLPKDDHRREEKS